MKKIAFFDTKPYDKTWFDYFNEDYQIDYFENKLNKSTARLCEGYDAVCAFVNDEIDAKTVDTLYENGVRAIAMRCAGYSNVDFKAAFNKINVMTVPAYSPHAVAEHAMALLLAINRKIPRAYNRTRDFNFNLNGLCGTDLFEKTAGIIGTGQIGKVFISICKGFGMKVICYDPYPDKNLDCEYVSLDTLFEQSDVISLHCPLTKDTNHILNKEAFSKMKKGVFIINTSRGALIDSLALLDALNNGIVKAAGLDVYEEEKDIFFEDFSDSIIKDDVLSLLVAKPNVILTSHQAFLTDEALCNIAKITLKNLDEFFENKPLTNEVCYHCKENRVVEKCKERKNGRCF